MVTRRASNPVGRPDINSGKPWSPMDIADLKAFLPIDKDIAETARFLCRSVAETQVKADELGLQRAR